jgi:hypothetical protein
MINIVWDIDIISGEYDDGNKKCKCTICNSKKENKGYEVCIFTRDFDPFEGEQGWIIAAYILHIKSLENAKQIVGEWIQEYTND